MREETPTNVYATLYNFCNRRAVTIQTNDTRIEVMVNGKGKGRYGRTGVMVVSILVKG